MNNKNPIFLLEFEPISMTTLGIAMLGLGSISTLLGLKQNAFNNHVLKNFQIEIYNSKNQQQCLQILNKYCNQLVNSCPDRKLAKKFAAAQYYIKTNFERPCLEIIHSQDQNWKNNLNYYIKNSSSKIKTKQNIKNAVNVGGLALGGGALAGNATMGALSMAKGIYSILQRNIQYFSSNRYINKMLKELENCPDNNRQLAMQIISKYSYNVSNNIQNLINKSGKKIPFNVQQKIRQNYIPLTRFISNMNDPYWKIKCIDYIKENKIQQGTQLVCDSILHYVAPYTMTKGAQFQYMKSALMPGK